MSIDIYSPRADTVPGRVIAYFRRLPDEELSAKDIALKFEVEPGGVHSQLKLAVDHEMLTRDGAVYSAGPKIGKAEPGTRLTDTIAMSAQKKARKPNTAGPFELPDLASVPIQDNVPLIAKKRAPVDWDTLLNRLQVNQSCQLPSRAKGTLCKAITVRHAANNGQFAVRKISEDQIRVWRTA